MEWRKTDGGIVDAELLRPRDWVASSHLEIGSIFEVFSTELELNGIAEITAISLCPPLSTGDGEVVTGRFVTRKADETVRMTFETGDTLEGSKSHPIWSPTIQDWVPMEEWAAGDAVLGRDGWITVTSIEVRNESVPLYNIEVRGEHVYEVTEAAILVHNSNDYGIAAGASVGSAQVSELKIIVIGETMARITEHARKLRSMGIDAQWYRAWAKNFPTNRPMTPAELAAAIKRNERWLRMKIAQGYKIVDIGFDVAKKAPSRFYAAEKNLIDTFLRKGWNVTVLWPPRIN